MNSNVFLRLKQVNNLLYEFNFIILIVRICIGTMLDKNEGEVMKKIALGLMLSVMVFVLQGYRNDENCVVCSIGSLYKNDINLEDFSDDEPIAEVTAKELLEKIKTKNNKIMIVNVLGKRFYEDAHIAAENSISAPLRILEEMCSTWDKNQEIVVYCACRECDASAKAYRLLKSKGFTNVAAYEGGMREWYKFGYPCEGACKYEYLIGIGEEGRYQVMKDGPLKRLMLEIYWGVRA